MRFCQQQQQQKQKQQQMQLLLLLSMVTNKLCSARLTTPLSASFLVCCRVFKCKALAVVALSDLKVNLWQPLTRQTELPQRKQIPLPLSHSFYPLSLPSCH